MKKRQDDPLASILVVDQEKNVYELLQPIASSGGFKINHASSLQEFFDKSSSASFDVVLIRNVLPDGSAAEAIAQMGTAADDSPEMIVFAQEGDPDEAERFLKNGAWDYIVTPTNSSSMQELLEKTIRYRRERQGKDTAKYSAIRSGLQSEGMIGSSPALQGCINQVAKAALTDANVLISGESGTGKELFAISIHKVSPRAVRDFIVVDCAALPGELVESILFGHERGAFTSAEKSQTGLIKQADDGTLFLDEIGEMPLSIQKKLLRVLHERAFRPVGSSKVVKSDFRLIAATNRNLEQMASQGDFREDLLFRLKTFHIELPPLRVRREDITELAYFFNSRYARQTRKKAKQFSPDLLMVLKQYDWPGNVRELFQTLERAIAAAGERDTIYPTHLPVGIRVQVARRLLEGRQSSEKMTAASEIVHDNGGFPPLQSFRQKALEAEEKKYLEKLMDHTRGDIKESCRIAGLSRSRLYDLLKKYQLIGHKH